MTKKYFIKFANYIKNMACKKEAKAVAAAVVACQDNPRFNRLTFYKACGLDRIAF